MAVRHLFPQNTGVLSGLWSSGVLEMGCWSPWRRGVWGEEEEEEGKEAGIGYGAP